MIVKFSFGKLKRDIETLKRYNGRKYHIRNSKQTKCQNIDEENNRIS